MHVLRSLLGMTRTDSCDSKKVLKNTIALFLIIAGLNCSSAQHAIWQPQKQPYRFHSQQPIAGDDLVLADLNGDGFTEIIAIYNSLAPGRSGSYILLVTFEGKTMEQTLFAGHILNCVTPMDCNHDGVQEILVPFVRHDSLFLSIVDHRGQKQSSFFLINGQPRMEDGGSFEWDPFIRGLYLQDINQDGQEELITVITTGYARLPRGVLVHSLADGKLIGKKIIGSPPRDNFLDDFDGDGQPEILCFGTAPANGADYGGFNDRQSYLITFALSPEPQVIRWRPVSNKFSNYVLFYEDIDGDSKKELLAWTECNSDRNVQSKIIELNPLTLEKIRQSQYNLSFISANVANLNRDNQLEILIAGRNRELIVLNHRFEQIQQRRLPVYISGIKKLSAIGTNGAYGIIASSKEGEILLDASLQPQACFPNMGCVGVVRRGEFMPPLLVMRNKNWHELGVLVKNRYYLLARYYSVMLTALVIGLLVSLGIFSSQLYFRCQLFRGVQSLVLDTDVRGILLFDRHLNIYQMNHTLRRWCGISGAKNNRRRQHWSALSRFPEVANFLTESAGLAPRRYEKIFQLQLPTKTSTCQVIVEPVPIASRYSHFWLAFFFDNSRDEEIVQARTWCHMAQKTAHDIKNPLTTIRLTLERLQAMQQNSASEAAEKFNLYIKRIIERVESLRRISQNFMKFVNVDHLNPVNTNINEFLNGTIATIRAGLPPDIQIELQSAANLPIIKIDQEAMHSVIENLVSNAVNAMPDGGKITISTQFLEKLTVPGNDQIARDYVLIEVLDTGIGIAAADREHLFEPDFTRTEGGNGLGLTYVKKTVDDHQGYIEVSGEPGAGTVFSIYLPTPWPHAGTEIAAQKS